MSDDVIISVEHLFTRCRLGQIGIRPEEIEHQGRKGRKGEEVGVVNTAPRGTLLPSRSSVKNSEELNTKAAKDAKGNNA